MEARAPARGNSGSRFIDRLRKGADYYDPHPIDAHIKWRKVSNG